MGQNSKIGLVVFVTVLFAGIGVFVVYMAAQQDNELHGLPLSQTRAQYETKLTNPGPAPGKFDNTPPPGAEVVQYDSKGRKLMAWIVKPALKGKRPAVLYAHGGNMLGKGDYDDIEPFIGSGFVVMLPAWRGENGNPGNYEMCLGEVDDALGALDYLSKQKEVDSKMLFAAGHSIGATTVMLLAESTPKLKKIAACGGYPDMRQTGAYPDAPFKSDVKELDVRSPAQFVKDLSCPLLLFYGAKDAGDQTFMRQAERMAEKSKQLGKSIEVKGIPDTDHFTALPQAIPQMVSFFSSN
jgi:dipeptidyl aminopeptidase/acylaminoacyl peptidase